LASEKFGQKIRDLQTRALAFQNDLNDLYPFKVDFLDREGFKKFADDLPQQTGDCQEIRITGYFSETVREALEILVKRQGVFSVKLICPEFPIQSKRDVRNLAVLEKLGKAGIEVKINNRLHARFLVASYRARDGGLLILGSFDFNTECIGKERYDAGIITHHPDLVKSAVELFDNIWNEPESVSLEEFKKACER
jgi:hypothetical protein